MSVVCRYFHANNNYCNYSTDYQRLCKFLFFVLRIEIKRICFLQLKRPVVECSALKKDFVCQQVKKSKIVVEFNKRIHSLFDLTNFLLNVYPFKPDFRKFKKLLNKLNMSHKILLAITFVFSNRFQNYAIRKEDDCPLQFQLLSTKYKKNQIF